MGRAGEAGGRVEQPVRKVFLLADAGSQSPYLVARAGLWRAVGKPTLRA